MPTPSLTLRNTKGSALTFTEMDNNLQNLANANVLLTAGGTTTSIALNSGFTLTAGTNITITNSSGNVVINNSLTAYSNVQVASYLAGNITVGNIAGKTSGFTLGYLEMPQVAGGNVTLALADSAKHFYRSTTAPHTITIPLNSSVAFGNGTVVSIVNQAVGNITLTPTGGVSLYLGGNSTSAGRTITTYGVATVMKVATDTWFVNGTGVV